MSSVCYIGDEATAAGFRLAGARVLTPAAGQEPGALATARGDATLILISAAVASRIPPRDIVNAELALAPLTLVVPDLTEGIAAPDLAAHLRRQLGLEESR